LSGSDEEFEFIGLLGGLQREMNILRQNAFRLGFPKYGFIVDDKLGQHNIGGGFGSSQYKVVRQGVEIGGVGEETSGKTNNATKVVEIGALILNGCAGDKPSNIRF